MSNFLGLLDALIPTMRTQRERDEAYLGEALDIYDLKGRMREFDARGRHPISDVFLGYGLWWRGPMMVGASLDRVEPRQCMDDPPFDWARGVAASIGHLVRWALRLPFDIARAVHAAAARSGLIQRSILESRNFEHALMVLEQFTLGPWARRV
jgi:hypothetical protein